MSLHTWSSLCTSGGAYTPAEAYRVRLGNRKNIKEPASLKKSTILDELIHLKEPALLMEHTHLEEPTKNEGAATPSRGYMSRRAYTLEEATHLEEPSQ